MKYQKIIQYKNIHNQKFNIANNDVLAVILIEFELGRFIRDISVFDFRSKYECARKQKYMLWTP